MATKRNQQKENESGKKSGDELKASLGRPNKGNDPLKVSGRNEAVAEREAREGGTRVGKAAPAGADTGSREAFEQTRPGDRLQTEDDEAVLSHSQAYRDKYSEVMRDFYAGQLRGKASNMIIKDVTEARAMAREQATIADTQTLG